MLQGISRGKAKTGAAMLHQVSCRAGAVAVAGHHEVKPGKPSKSGSGSRKSRPAVSPRSAGDRQLSSTAAAAGAAALDGGYCAMAQGGEAMLNSAVEFRPHRGFGSALSKYRALVLDSSYRPVDVVNWQRAICMDLLSKADALEYYDVFIHSVSDAFPLPAVLKTRFFNGKANQQGRLSLNRQNLLLRDKFECQYCGSSRDLTLDHVHPVSKGGGNTWENLVTCCSACNSKKGDKTLKQLNWKLRQTPREPSPRELDFMLSTVLHGMNPSDVPEEWQAYILPILQKASSKKSKAAALEQH